MESLELFGREVLPEFAERDEAQQREKAERLEPVIEAVMARKPAADHPPLRRPTTRSPAIPRADRRPIGQSTQFHEWLDQFEESIAGGDDLATDISKHLA